MLESLHDFDGKVAGAREEFFVPGVTFAVLHDGKVTSSAAGVLSMDTGIEARPDSLFQVGSITKSLTATLVMQMAEEGLIDIDAPVTRYIGARVGRGPSAETFTARQLMAHTSGLDGDLFLDTGRDEDALAKYMIVGGQLEFMAPPGRYYNYSNAGYATLGRLVEVVRGVNYDRALDEFLFGRIGATRSTTMPEVAAFRRASSGHGLGADGAYGVVPLVHMPRAMGPAGLTLHSTAEELAAYAGAHMSESPLLSRASAKAMRAPQIGLAENASWGLGWKIIPAGNTVFVGHDGGVIGQVASLWTVPEKKLAVAMCCNGGYSRKIWEAIAYPIFREVCGAVPAPAIPGHAPAPRPLSLYEGVYDNLGVTMFIRATGDHLTAEVKHKFFGQPGMSFAMHSLGEDRFRVTLGDDDKIVMAFLDPGPDGRPDLFYAGRLHKRRGNLP